MPDVAPKLEFNIIKKVWKIKHVDMMNPLHETIVLKRTNTCTLYTLYK